MRVKLVKIPWSGTAESEISVYNAADIDDLRRQVVTGESELFACFYRDNFSGYLITRLEVRNDFTTLVVVVGMGKNGKAIFRALTEIADSNSYKMRVHSSRPGMARYLADLDFCYSETIYKRI